MSRQNYRRAEQSCSASVGGLGEVEDDSPDGRLLVVVRRRNLEDDVEMEPLDSGCTNYAWFLMG